MKNLSFRKRNRYSSSTSSKSTPSQWCNLGADILEEITRRFHTPAYIHGLRAVCKGWRSSIPFPTPPNPNNNNDIIVLKHARLPLIFPFTIFKNFEGPHYLLLKENTIYSLQPIKVRGRKPKVARRWFVKIEETESGKVLLKDPLSLSRMPIKNLEKHTSLPKVINLLDYKVREIGKEYRLQHVQGETQLVIREEVTDFKKVVVGQNKDGQFVVMALHISEKLLVWKMGEDRWVGIDYGFDYKDIAHHKGRFYAVNDTKRIIAVDCSSLEITQVAPSTPQNACQRIFSYLVKSQEQDDLYLINRYDCSYLNVFKLDEELGKWDSNGSWLSDWVMFVGDGGFSCSFLAAEFGGCKLGNCIYIRDSCFSRYSNTGKFEYNKALSLKTLSLYSKFFWPPPTWLMQTDQAENESTGSE